MIFAAGRGTRMRPLTDTRPKPLLEAGGKPLLVWHLERLHAAGVHEVVINISHLAEQFPAQIGSGRCWGLDIHWQHEPPGALETGGGLLAALPRLGAAPFLILSGDVWCDLDPATLPREPPGEAHLVLVDNPAHHPEGDFRLAADGRVRRLEAGVTAGPVRTFAGIAVCRPALLARWRELPSAAVTRRGGQPAFRLAPLLRRAAAAGRLDGRQHTGRWCDVGTPARLAALDAALRA